MYTPVEYSKILQMSAKRRVLVEGRDDYYLILALFDEFLGVEWRDVYNIEIDKAENSISAPGNRQAIESVVRLVANTDLREKLVGLVDREFRNFDWGDGKILDQLQSHFVDDRLLWTRGHSAENYFLDKAILRVPFRDVSGEIFQKAYDIFVNHIDSYLRIASKLSLTALTLNYMKRIRASLGWDIISESADLDVEKWTTHLNAIGFNLLEIKKIISAYSEIGVIIDSTDVKTVRWFCDGHLSFFFLWCSFAKCVYIATDSVNDKNLMAHCILKYGDETRFNSCASAWAKSSKVNLCEYPKELFDMLNLSERDEVLP